jgi:hypothetical protein
MIARIASRSSREARLLPKAHCPFHDVGPVRGIVLGILTDMIDVFTVAHDVVVEFTLPEEQ